MAGLAKISGAAERLDVKVDTDEGHSTSLVSGPKTVSFNKNFAAVESVTASPNGTAARTYAIDFDYGANPASFDIYIFDGALNQIACEFSWNARGTKGNG